MSETLALSLFIVLAVVAVIAIVGAALRARARSAREDRELPADEAAEEQQVEEWLLADDGVDDIVDERQELEPELVPPTGTEPAAEEPTASRDDDAR
jgi:hypothetical protein